MDTNKNKVSDVAAALDLSKRRVQQLVKAGVLPAPIRGVYDLVKCIQSYEEYSQEPQIITNSVVDDLAIEKLRLVKAQARNAELKVQILEDKYILLEEVELSLSSLVIAFRSRMLSLPHKLVRQIIALDNDAKAIVSCLEEEIHDALMELSKYKYSDEDRDAEAELE